MFIFKKAIIFINKWSTPASFYLFHFLFISSWGYTSVKFTSEVLYPGKHHKRATVARKCALFGALFTLLMIIIIYLLQGLVNFLKQKAKHQIWLRRNDLQKSKWAWVKKHGPIFIRFATCFSFPIVSAVLGDKENVDAYTDMLCSGMLSILFLCINFGLMDDGGAADAVNAVVMGIVYRQHHKIPKILLAALIPTLYHVIPLTFKNLLEWAEGPRGAAGRARSIAKKARNDARDARLKANQHGAYEHVLNAVAAANEAAATAMIAVAVANESLATSYEAAAAAVDEEVAVAVAVDEEVAVAAAVEADAIANPVADDEEVPPPVWNRMLNLPLHLLTGVLIVTIAIFCYCRSEELVDSNGGQKFHSVLSFVGTNLGKK